MGLQSLKIGVVGGGWNGCHLALELTKDGHEVEVFEKQSEIFRGFLGILGSVCTRGPTIPVPNPLETAAMSRLTSSATSTPILSYPMSKPSTLRATQMPSVTNRRYQMAPSARFATSRPSVKSLTQILRVSEGSMVLSTWTSPASSLGRGSGTTSSTNWTKRRSNSISVRVSRKSAEMTISVPFSSPTAVAANSILLLTQRAINLWFLSRSQRAFPSTWRLRIRHA